MDHGLEVVEDLVALLLGVVLAGGRHITRVLVLLHLECHLGYHLVNVVVDVLHDHFEPL